jgi:hypothetical protein
MNAATIDFRYSSGVILDVHFEVYNVEEFPSAKE